MRAADGRVAGTLPIINGLAVRLPAGARARLAHDRADRGGQRQRVDPLAERPLRPDPARDRLPGVGARPAGLDSDARPARASASRSSTPASTAAWPTSPTRNGDSRVVASVVTNPDATTPNDSYGHGTHVAGIIAGDGTRRAGRRPARGPLRRRRPGREPDRDQGVRRPRPRDDPRRDLRPAVRRRPQGRLQHPRRQPVAVLDGRRVLPDRPARRRGRGRVLPRHRRRRRRRQPRHRRRRGAATRRPTTRSRSPSARSTTRGPRPAPTTPSPTGRAAASTQDGFAKPEIARSGRAHRLDARARQRVRHALPAVHRRRRLHPGRRHLDGRAGRRRRRRAGAPGPPGLDARPGQVDADRDRPRRPRRRSTRSTPPPRSAVDRARVRRQRRPRPERR